MRLLGRKPLWLLSALALSLLLLLLPRALRSQASSSVPLRIIVVPTAQQAQTILDRLRKGEDFAALARQSSTDPTANQGGYVGTVDPANLRPELRDGLKGLAPGDLTNIIQIPAGYAILKILKAPLGVASNTADPTRLLPLTGPGNVRLTADISGYGQALAAILAVHPKIPTWGMDLRQVCDVRQQATQTGISKMQEALAGGGMNPDREAYIRFTLGQLWAYLGQMDQALDQWNTAYQLATANSLPLSKILEEGLAIGYLHRASLADHVAHGPVDDAFLFPAHPGGLHPRLDDLRQAINYFTKSLATDPNNYELRWLLNISYMTAGWYPDKVPATYLIPPSSFKSKENIGRFTDIAPAAGLDIYGMAGGVIVDDFENNGLFDIVTSELDDCAPLKFFHNNGDGTFTNRTAQAKLSDQLGGLNLIQADYNNDGCVDILVLRGAWDFPRRLSLLRNNCNGTFTDVTEQSGLGKVATSTQTAAWADINNDGNLDLFIGNEYSPSQLFLNKGNGTFEDISHNAGIDRVAFSKAVIAGDYDNDGYPDFYVSNLNGENFLYHNNGDTTFTEVAATAGAQAPWASFAAWFFDYDNDGWPDLFVTSYANSTEEVARSYLGLPHNAETLKLYKNLGNGTFKDVTADAGLDHVYMPMGSNFGDIDNDGYLDIYLGNGNPSYGSEVPNVLLHNRAGKSFVDISSSSGTGAMVKGHGVAFADFANDGNQEIFAVMGGAVPGDRHNARLFEPPSNGNDWITVHLIGVRSNRSAIGARIKVTVSNAGAAQRSIYRTVSSGGSFGASPLEQHIGLGKSAHIDTIDIWWPTSKTHQSFSNVPVNQFLEIKEFASTYTKLHRHSFHLGGPKLNSNLAVASERAKPALHE